MMQSKFNNIYTICITIFFACVYIYAFLSGRTIDWQILIAFIVPTTNHIVHQITQSSLSVKRIEVEAMKVSNDTSENGGSH